MKHISMKHILVKPKNYLEFTLLVNICQCFKFYISPLTHVRDSFDKWDEYQYLLFSYEEQLQFAQDITGYLEKGSSNYKINSNYQIVEFNTWIEEVMVYYLFKDIKK